MKKSNPAFFSSENEGTLFSCGRFATRFANVDASCAFVVSHEMKSNACCGYWAPRGTSCGLVSMKLVPVFWDSPAGAGSGATPIELASLGTFASMYCSAHGPS